MQKESHRILLIELLLTVIAIVQIFLAEKFVMTVYLASLFVVGLIAFFLIGYKKREERYSKDVLLVLIVGCISYYLITYIIGYFSGFMTTGYSRSFSGMFKNIMSSLLLIIIIEFIRFMVLKKERHNKKLVFLSIIIFTLIEVTTKFSLAQMNARADIVKLILSVIVPSLSKNVLLAYIAYNTDWKNAIVYRCFMDLPVYIIPIVPDLGDYISTIFLTIQPLVILLFIYRLLFGKRTKIVDTKKTIKLMKYQKLLTLAIGFILVILVVLVSGVGRFLALTIGSGSMTGTINKGDVVVVDKKDKTYEKNDIIAFQYENRIFVHRIIKIEKKENIEYYQTKGDANNDKDAWLVKPEDIVGVYKFRVMFIGWPTVTLNEWLNG